jgi:zinc/manganese transport system permease protein
MSVLATTAGWQSDWFEIMQSGFMRNALIGGTLVALASGLVGYYVVVRQSAFAAHALAHIGFPGATAAVLVGVPVMLGLSTFCIAGGLAIGLLGQRAAHREVATGTVLSLATALGVLFNSLASRSSSTVTSVLFGNLLAISHDQLVVFALFTAVLAVGVGIVARPLTFASVDPQVAQARGVPVRALGVVFVVLLALAVTMAVQVVGTLLLFALVVTPSATALLLTPRPGRVMALGALLATASVWCGLVLSAMFNLPPSFCIVSVAVATWLVALALTRDRHRSARAAHGEDVDRHHHHPHPAGRAIL